MIPFKYQDWNSLSPNAQTLLINIHHHIQKWAREEDGMINSLRARAEKAEAEIAKMKTETYRTSAACPLCGREYPAPSAAQGNSSDKDHATQEMAVWIKRTFDQWEEACGAINRVEKAEAELARFDARKLLRCPTCRALGVHVFQHEMDGRLSMRCASCGHGLHTSSNTLLGAVLEFAGWSNADAQASLAALLAWHGRDEG